MATVRIHLPENETPTVLNLTGARISVGRLPHNTIQIIDRTISALHAEFIKEGDHYRLHDRGSVNGTFVNGESVTDYHLRDACRLGFGAFECEFSPALAPTTAEDSLENLPSRGEINEVRHENAKLRNQVELLREEVATLTKATATGAENGSDNLLREELVRVVGEMEKLKESLNESGEEVKRLKNNLAVLQRDRGNLQRAWEDSKAELLKARLTPTPVGIASAAPAAPSEELVNEPVEETPIAAQESAEPVAAAPVVEATPPPFKPVSKPSVPPGKLFVPPSPASAPAKGPTVTQAQPFVPPPAPKAQPGSGSGIRPFPKANPPTPVAKPALAENAPLAQPTAVKPTAFPTAKPFAKVPTATPAAAGPKGTQKITVTRPK